MLEHAFRIIFLRNGLHLRQAAAAPVQRKWPLSATGIIEEDVRIIQPRGLGRRIYALNQ